MSHRLPFTPNETQMEPAGSKLSVSDSSPSYSHIFFVVFTEWETEQACVSGKGSTAWAALIYFSLSFAPFFF